MIYVSDNFSMRMFEKKKYKIISKKIKKSILLRNTKETISNIGSWRIARLIHKKVGKQRITLQSGDEIYVITSKFGRNKTDYKKENTYRYQVYKVQ
ncbi:MAG: hypothetical protein IJI98_07925 [Methanosphaera sp.]|nr:hypothetical protein [Methanosphaera sp.]